LEEETSDVQEENGIGADHHSMLGLTEDEEVGAVF
jgi:hypothetical protein